MKSLFQILFRGLLMNPKVKQFALGVLFGAAITAAAGAVGVAPEAVIKELCANTNITNEIPAQVLEEK